MKYHDRPTSRRVYLSAIGDVNDPRTWSGIPYHCLEAGCRAGVIDEGLPLSAAGLAWSMRRIGWNLARVLGGDRRGGYQYSVEFLERLWQPVRNRIAGGIVLSMFQLLPPSVVEDPSIEKWFFVDATLTQLFDCYRQRDSVGRRIAGDALERERLGYLAAAGVIAHSRWAAESMIRDYRVPAERVHVIVPGASLAREPYEEWSASAAFRAWNTASPLRVAFVGKYWDRKGLDRLLRATRICSGRGVKVEVGVIGCPRHTLPPDLRNVPGTQWLGFVDKRTDTGRFLRILASFDLGCLLSRAEAGGIALREYHAAGLPVIGPATGGAPEHMLPEASIGIAPAAPDEAVADCLASLARDPDRLNELRKTAWKLRREVLWDKSVAQLAPLIGRARSAASS